MLYGRRKIKSSINIHDFKEGVRLEDRVTKWTEEGTPIDDSAPIIYTERKYGVFPEHDIRTDRFELAIDAMDKVTKSRIAKSEEADVKKDDEKPVEGAERKE